MNNAANIATVTGRSSVQTLSAISQYRRFEISIAKQGDDFTVDTTYASNQGQIYIPVWGISEKKVSDALIAALKKINTILKGVTAIDDGESVFVLLLEGASQYISLDDVKTLLANNQMGYSAVKI